MTALLPLWQRRGMERVHPLRAFRKERSLTRAELARMLDVTPSTVWRWEKGKRSVGREDLPRISEATGIAPAELRPDLAELMRAGGDQ